MRGKAPWEEWVKKLPAQRPPFRRRSARERLGEALDVINLVRIKPDPLEKPVADLSEGNWASALVKLHAAVEPLSGDPQAVEREAELAEERRKVPPGITFDVPELYGAKSDGTPTHTATFRLLAALSWTLSALLGGVQGETPGTAIAWLQHHFEWLSARKWTPEGFANFTLRVVLEPRTDPQGGIHEVPRLVVGASGIDTKSWLLLLDFFGDHPNFRDLLGKCPVCLRLFEKPRKDAVYCGEACAQKARYERWKERGGLKKRKRRRILGGT